MAPYLEQNHGRAERSYDSYEQFTTRRQHIRDAAVAQLGRLIEIASDPTSMQRRPHDDYDGRSALETMEDLSSSYLHCRGRTKESQFYNYFPEERKAMAVKKQLGAQPQ